MGDSKIESVTIAGKTFKVADRGEDGADVMPMSREDATQLARRICSDGEKLVAPGTEIVVVVTDAAGDWVGVAATAHHGRTIAILDSALHGADYKWHGPIDAPTDDRKPGEGE